MSISPKLVLPPVYRLQLPEHPDLSRWGWHRAKDILDAVNNILLLDQKQPMTALAIGRKFRAMPKGRGFHAAVSTVNQHGDVYYSEYEPKERYRWLDGAVKADEFLPAKIGTALIASIQKFSDVAGETYAGRKLKCLCGHEFEVKADDQILDKWPDGFSVLCPECQREVYDDYEE